VVKFMMKSFLLLLFLFLGVLFGMEHATNQMNEMKATDNTSAFEIGKDNQGKLEAEVLGQNVSNHDLKEKHKQLEEMKAFNFFSELGSKLSELISEFFKKVIAISIELINALIQLF
jgi:hypothetical protein